MSKNGEKIRLIIVIICSILFLVFASFIVVHMYLSLKSGEIPRDSVKTEREPWYISPEGVGIDSENNIYLGVDDYIMCFDEKGNYLHSYNIHTAGSFRFEISDDDNMVVAIVRADTIKIYNMEGQLLEKYDDVNAKEQQRLSAKSNYAENSSGIGYKLSNWFGYTKVIRVNDGKVMYRIPLNLYLVKIFIPIAFVLLMIMIGYPVRKWQKEIFGR